MPRFMDEHAAESEHGTHGIENVEQCLQCLLTLGSEKYRLGVDRKAALVDTLSSS